MQSNPAPTCRIDIGQIVKKRREKSLNKFYKKYESVIISHPRIKKIEMGESNQIVFHIDYISNKFGFWPDTGELKIEKKNIIMEQGFKYLIRLLNLN